MYKKYKELSAFWQFTTIVFVLLIAATVANILIDGGAAAHDLLCPDHGLLFN